jgi:small nuclear ribonucleoprotein (snRNP)-like protein
MRKQFWTVLLIFFILSAAAGQAQWRITTTQGNVYRGVIVNQDNDIINLKTLDNTELTLKREIVESTIKIQTRIETKSGDQYTGFVTTIDDNRLKIILEEAGEIEINRADIVEIEAIDDRDILGERISDQTYSALGITFFGPGMINLSYSHSTEEVGVKVCAGTIGFNFGWQVNLLMNLNRTKTYNHNVSLGTGMMIADNFLWYAGVFYDINVYGLFLEFGLSTAIDEKLSLGPTFQVGYLFEF